MKSYYDLIISDIVNFDRILIRRYKFLGLDETDCIILMKLHEGIKRGKLFLDIESLRKTMTLSSDELSGRIVKLVNEDFISLKMEDIHGEEVISLDPVYRKLGYLLEDGEIKSSKKEEQNDLKMIVETIEKELNRVLTPAELQMVQKWLVEYKYSVEDIKHEIMNAAKYKNRGVNAINTALYKKYNKQEVIVEEESVDVLALYNQLYGKK